MLDKVLYVREEDSNIYLEFSGQFDLYKITRCEKQLDSFVFSSFKKIYIDLTKLSFLDTAGALFINSLQKEYTNVEIEYKNLTKDIVDTLELVKLKKLDIEEVGKNSDNLFVSVGKNVELFLVGFFSFFLFLKEVFLAKLHYLKSFKNIRIKEIIFEINESGIKALGIISITSILIGLVVAYQSAYQLKIYGANIFVVDMLGISMLRELAPLITAIVIAGRSGSAFTAQIGAMKITEELDAMRTMGFDPYAFLVLPRIIALMIVMPMLIFVSDMMGILGGIIVANLDLNISLTLFLDRFSTAVDIKHFYIGLFKGPFFAFLIATIGIYRGLKVKNDTQSIGFNTTRSVVESIFAVIVCDAIFSIIFTNMGI